MNHEHLVACWRSAAEAAMATAQALQKENEVLRRLVNDSFTISVFERVRNILEQHANELTHAKYPTTQDEWEQRAIAHSRTLQKVRRIVEEVR